MTTQVHLHVHPNTTPVTWSKFCFTSPPFAIALDGYVHGGPRFDGEFSDGPRANFNHHEDVDRLATRATCAQVHLAIRQGLFASFRDALGARAEVFVNDADQDVCLSWYLLKNHYRVEHTMNPLLNRLVDMEDKLDTTAGAYPYPVDLPILSELAWVFEPYTRARSDGNLDSRDSTVFYMVIEQVCSRIDQHLLGQGSSVPLDIRYEVLGRAHELHFVHEIGAHARTALFADGIRAFVSARKRADGYWTYSIGRMSQFVPFDVRGAFTLLNETEGLQDSADRWGGSDNVGGSPRVAGSRLDPVAVMKLLHEHYR